MTLPLTPSTPRCSVRWCAATQGLCPRHCMTAHTFPGTAWGALDNTARQVGADPGSLPEMLCEALFVTPAPQATTFATC